MDSRGQRLSCIGQPRIALQMWSKKFGAKKRKPLSKKNRGFDCTYLLDILSLKLLKRPDKAESHVIIIAIAKATASIGCSQGPAARIVP